MFISELGETPTAIEFDSSLPDVATDKSFAPIPTYPVVLPLKGDDQDVNLFSERVKGMPIPGLPHLDPNRIVRIKLSLCFIVV